jgi:type II secretion system protein N
MDKTQPQSSLIVEDLPVFNPAADMDDDTLSVTAASVRSQFGTDAWGDAGNPRAKKTRKLRTYLTYGVVGLFSFLLFLYFSFPFNVVKEVAISKVNEVFIQNKLPIRISVAGLKLKFPIGVQLENIEISNVNDSNAGVKIGRAVTTVSLLPVLWGKVDANVLITQSGGNLELSYSDKISSIIKMANSRNARLPSGKIDLEFRNFEIRSFVANALAFVRSGNNPALQTIQPLLRLNVSGALHGRAKLSLPEVSESFDKALADVDVSIKKATFKMDDETLAIPEQEFTDARVKLKLSKKSVDIPAETKFVAKDISINLSGRMNVSDNLSVNDVNLKLGLVLKGKIEENFKFLLPLMLSCDSSKLVDGKMDAELSGVFGALTCK